MSDIKLFEKLLRETKDKIKNQKAILKSLEIAEAIYSKQLKKVRET
ncbi:MAG: hypothetical protein GY853_00955 [PVC group bacterium]|nr:hypothetical protein [PVC group bacterium]